jgi:hypothetical protein
MSQKCQNRKSSIRANVFRSAPRSRRRNGIKRAVSVLSGLTCRRRDAGQIYCEPQWPNSEIRGSLGGVVHTWARESPTSREDMIMRLSSGFVAPSAVAILSTALLCALGSPAAPQTASSLPSITVDAPRQVARPQRPEVTPQGSGRVAHRAGRTSRSTQTATGTPTTGTPSAARGPIMAKLARLEREASSCNDGCESSFRHGKDPWVGCSESAGYYSVFSATCKDTLTHRDYAQCVETKMFLGWDRQRSWWYCTGMLAGGKFRVTAENRNR